MTNYDEHYHASVPRTNVWACKSCANGHQSFILAGKQRCIVCKEPAVYSIDEVHLSRHPSGAERTQTYDYL